MVTKKRRQLPPITREEACSKEEEYARSKHHQPVVLPTTKKYVRMKALWKEWVFYTDSGLNCWLYCSFLEYIGDDTPCLQKNENVPSPRRLKHFMKWIFETSFGLLTEHITLKSLKNTWYSFRSIYFRETDVAISGDNGIDVLCVRRPDFICVNYWRIQFIKTELRSKGLATVRREKAMADALDVAWLLTYLWYYDKHEFRHPRVRTQLGFILQLIIYTGSRPGAIVESSAYRGSNEAMCYKVRQTISWQILHLLMTSQDFELIGLPIGPKNTLELVLKVRLRYEKNNRDQD